MMIFSIDQLESLTDTIIQATDSLLNDTTNTLKEQPREDVEVINQTSHVFKDMLGQCTPDLVLTERFRHDLRAPLNSMLGFSELMLITKNRKTLFTEQQNQLLKNIHESSVSITKILDELAI